MRILKVDTSIILLHSLRNPIDKVQFSCPSFGAGGEHLVAAAHVGSQVQFYVWEVQSGHCLARPRDDDKDSQDRGPIQALAWHANGAVICTAAAHASQHAIRVWAAPDGFSWRAYAPNFEELHENITYNEREDEFDVAERKRPLSDPSGSVAKALANRELVARGAAVEAAARVTEAELAVRRELEAQRSKWGAERRVGGALPYFLAYDLTVPTLRRLQPEPGSARGAAPTLHRRARCYVARSRGRRCC